MDLRCRVLSSLDLIVFLLFLAFSKGVITDRTERYYSFGKAGLTPEFQGAAWPALDALDNTPGWDWSVFDLDNDNKLDSVVITHGCV